MRYLHTDSEHLMGLFEQMLINVAWNDAVKKAMFSTMHSTIWT